MEQKHRGLLAYLFGWLGGLIILYAYKDNDSRTKLNACQSIVLSVTSIIVSNVVRFIPGIGSYTSWIVSVLILVCQIIGMVKAFREEDFEIPVITDLTRNIFKKQLD